MTARRLIEAAFPLRQASLDSVHEKNVRHGHVSTLHIWPARRPLAAARAALIAALLPDPGTAEGRRLLLERIGGRVVEAVARKRVGGRVVETTREETTGGILHWGREDGPELDRFRAEIRAAHGGRAPRVLDPFAGGGAIPLEAMRLGCQATAVDINPVAWLLLKCTLDWPRRLAGRARPLPGFARADAGFMEALLKTRWLARKEGKRALLTMAPDGEGGIAFGVAAGSAGDDGAGTMSRAGATCPHCGTVNAMEDIRLEGRAGRLGAQMTAAVVDGPAGKEYRAPEALDSGTGGNSRDFAGFPDVPFGLPDEPICADRPSPNSRGASGLPRYGFDSWGSLFTDRQKLALATFVAELRACASEMDDYPEEWREALAAYLGLTISKLTDYSSSLCSWHNGGEKLRQTFARFALPMVWDFCEVNPLSDASGGFAGMADWVARAVEHLQSATAEAPAPQVLRRSAIEAPPDGGFDAIVTDPPYYDAIPYSDLMDFFHVWLRRALHGVSDEVDAAFAEPLGPKWDREAGDGELIDDASRFGGDRARSKAAYEDGMARAFRACHEALNPEGRLVVVFANKSPDAWETLAAALIRAGFVVAASWPIQTEMQTRQRSMASAALSSSVWLVCRKRAETRPGWDGSVLADMRANVARRLREFWDAGIRGPDFVWAATGPALEAFSRYPAVKTANAPGAAMPVSAFLGEVRRTVVDFVVGRVLAPDGDAEAAAGLDDATAYYLLHRHDFGMGDAPAGACILYALSCNLSDSELAGRLDLLARAKPGEGGGGAQARLKPWDRRRGPRLGLEGASGRPAPLIDRAHRLMRLWRAGDLAAVEGYLETGGLARDALFARVLQALIELAEAGAEERAVLESLSNHLAARERGGAPRQRGLGLEGGGSG